MHSQNRSSPNLYKMIALLLGLIGTEETPRGYKYFCTERLKSEFNFTETRSNLEKQNSPDGRILRCKWIYATGSPEFIRVVNLSIAYTVLPVTGLIDPLQK